MQTRSYEKEIMDEFDLGGEAMAQTLREITFINKWLGGNAVTTDGLDRMIAQTPIQESRPLTIADLGCGGGDMLLLMAEWAKKRKITAQLTGIDANSYIIQYAENQTANYSNIHYHHLDIFTPKFQQQPYDIVTCTLFCHHFTDEELIQLFRSLHTQTRIGIVINDLHRHWFAYHSISWLTQLFSKSYMVRNDARLSVKRGFTRKELENLLQQAGIRNVQIRWRWAFRWQICIFTSQ